MSKKNLGIEATAKALVWVAELSSEIATYMADGKLKLTELVKLSDNLFDLKGVLPQLKDVPAEVMDLTLEEELEIQKRVAEKLDLPSDKAELIAARSLAIVLNMIGIATIIKEMKQ